MTTQNYRESKFCTHTCYLFVPHQPVNKRFFFSARYFVNDFFIGGYLGLENIQIPGEKNKIKHPALTAQQGFTEHLLCEILQELSLKNGVYV